MHHTVIMLSLFPCTNVFLMLHHMPYEYIKAKLVQPEFLACVCDNVLFPLSKYWSFSYGKTTRALKQNTTVISRISLQADSHKVPSHSII